MPKIKIDPYNEVVDEIVSQRLKLCAKDVQKDYEELMEDMHELKEYQLHDLAEYTRTLKALKVVHDWFSMDTLEIKL